MVKLFKCLLIDGKTKEAYEATAATIEQAKADAFSVAKDRTGKPDLKLESFQLIINPIVRK